MSNLMLTFLIQEKDNEESFHYLFFVLYSLWIFAFYFK